MQRQTESRSTGANRQTGVHLGDRTDFVDIRAESGRLEITLVGAPEGRHIYEGMQVGYAGGWIATSMPTLIDVLTFNGSIDWVAIKAVAKMANWGKDDARPARVAYLTRDPLFVMVVKVVAVLFPHSLHRVFGNRHAALTWLQTKS